MDSNFDEQLVFLGGTITKSKNMTTALQRLWH